MFVRMLIGPAAGRIIDLSLDVAQSCLMMGTHAAVTDQEIAEAGFIVPSVTEAPPETLPEGFTVRDHEAGGLELLDPDGNPVQEAPIRNLAEARGIANEIIAKKAESKDGGEEIVVPDNWQELDFNARRSLAAKIAPGEAKNSEAANAIIQNFLDKSKA